MTDIPEAPPTDGATPKDSPATDQSGAPGASAAPAPAPPAAPMLSAAAAPPAAQEHVVYSAPSPVSTALQPLPDASYSGATAGAPPVTSAAASRAKWPLALALVAALAVGALIGGISGAGIALWASSRSSSAPIRDNAGPTTITVNDTKSVSQITAVAAKASASVVTLAVTSGDSGGTGSGVIVSADGYALTNTHVVTLDGAAAETTVTVTTNDGRILNAAIVGTDPISDLAVIKIEGAQDLQPAEFADSAKLNVGDTAIAIGAPLGLAGTVTNGIISALNRSITIASAAAPEQGDGTEQDPNKQDPYGLFNFDVPGQTPSAGSSSTISLSVIQTDAAINPGNSGGALLNSDGQVIGINVAIASAGNSGSGAAAGSIGVGFAVPANLAQRVMNEIIADGVATHGLLGASVANVTADTEPTAKNQVVGASIKELTPGGAAEVAGLKVGDVITTFEGLPITGKTDLTAQVRSLAAGASASLTYVRGGKTAQAEVTLGALR
ncbi:MAG: S1C family serine protease [Rhodoglobus sp.]